MKLRLERTRCDSNGAFGVLVDEHRDPICYTLEHAYAFDDFHSGNIIWKSKIPAGMYSVKRGLHRLLHYSSGQPFVTFEVTGVPGHSKILFHPGNTKADSDGCILVGSRRENNVLINSRPAFEKFLNFLSTVDEFELEVA